jgi:hypothetical protein
MLAFRAPKDHDASHSTVTSCSSISGTSVSLLAWKRSVRLFPRFSPRVAHEGLLTKGCSPRVAPCSVSFAGYDKEAQRSFTLASRRSVLTLGYRRGPEKTGWYGGPDLGLTRRSYGGRADRIAVAAPPGLAHAARASPPLDALGTSLCTPTTISLRHACPFSLTLKQFPLTI